MAKSKQIGEGRDAMIPIGGIVTSLSEDVCKDGNMEEIINLRHKNGSLRPIGSFPYALFESDGITPSDYVKNCSKVYVHTNNDYENWVGLVGANLIYFAQKNNGVVKLVTPITLLSNLTDPQISSVKNILTVSWTDKTAGVVTDVHRKYILWNNDAYNVLNPDFLNPCFNFYLSGTFNEQISFSDMVSNVPNEATLVNPSIEKDYQQYEGVYSTLSKRYSHGESLTYDDASLVWTAMQGVVNKSTGILKEKGKICGMVLVRYAIQLYDGSYIKHSPIMLVNCQENNGSYTYGYRLSTNSFIINDDQDTFFQKILLVGALSNGYDLKMVYQKTVPSEWKDLITSVDIFMSSPIKLENYTDRPDEILAGSTDGGPSPTFLNPILYNDDVLKDKILSTNSFYKIKSIKVEDLIGTDYTPITDTIDLKSKLSILETLETLNDDEYSYTKMTSKSVYLYNQKEHLGNIISKYFSGYPFMYYQLKPGLDFFDISNKIEALTTAVSNPVFYTYSGTTVQAFDKTKISYITIVVKLKNAKDVILRVDSTTPDYLSSIYNYISQNITGFFTYPDSRAYNVHIYIGTTDNTYYELSLDLVPHTYLNLACSINDYLTPHILMPVMVFGGNDPNSIPAQKNIIEYRPNVLKCSVTDNPIVFKDSATYQVGTGEIRGMCSNTNAISLGQFGEYPLIVYCSDGRWALGLGSGDVDYSSIKPLSRDVCNNPKSITPIDKAIVFTSENGLIVDGTSDVENISQIIEADPYDFTTGFDRIDLLSQATNHPQLVQLHDQITKTPFMEYLEGSIMAFCYRDDKELIISNPNFAYSYIYNFDTKTYYKSDYHINLFINDYPNTYACFSDGYTRSLSGEVYDGHRQTFILTRPIKVFGETWKEAYRSVLRSLIVPTGKSVGFYVFGSEDGLMWRFLGGTETDGKVRMLPQLSLEWTGHGCEITDLDSYTQLWKNHVCEKENVVLSQLWSHYVCEKIANGPTILTMEAVRTSANTLLVQHWQYQTYGEMGTVFFKPGGFLQNGSWPIDNQSLKPNVYTKRSQEEIPNANVIAYSSGLWINGNSNTTDGRMNKCGIWLQGDWTHNGTLGFGRSIDIPSDGIYYFGCGADNFATLKIDGETVVQQDLSVVGSAQYLNDVTGLFDTALFRYWHMYPIQLSKGTHVIEMLNTNTVAANGDPSPGDLAFEIYNATEEQLIACNTETDLDQYTIFSTKNIQDGDPFDIGNWHCEDPTYQLVQKGGVYSCQKIIP